jgi:bifunctional non-homologous end joining protein LigD
VLREYRAKRDFHSTPEPAARASAPARGGARRAKTNQHADERIARFVVHEHHARRLHWDLRLERGGALMSWAVPNGIPNDPHENRKAVHVEDHPLEYLDFEGDIPEGSYGAGHIGIWDRGHYEAEKIEQDKVVVVFHGERLRGRYALFRAGEEERDWMIHRMDPPESPREPMPDHIAPMLATAGELPGKEAGWGFEIKWDGVRVIAHCKPGRLHMESRNGNDVTARYPELRALARQLAAREAVLDGEIVAFDEQGSPSFERLQKRMHQTSESVVRRLSREMPVTYMIFDLLYLEGRSTMDLPYRERRALLGKLELEGPSWQTPAYRERDGRALLAASAEHGLEGLVAKRLDSPYRPGERSVRWLKIKNTTRQELVIGGWLPGKGNREGRIGALLMGYREGKGVEAGRAEAEGAAVGERAERVLRYAGRVGTGFDEAELERLATELKPLARRSSPFAKRGVQPPRESRFVEPELVAEIQFSHWTRERILRHSVYRGLRPDKPAAEVEIEIPLSATAVEAALAKDSPSKVAKRAGQRAARGEGSAVGRGAGRHRRGGELPYTVLHQTARHTEIEVEGVTLRLSNRDKVLYPQTGFTKGDLIDYYAMIAPALLPHLAGRPLTLKRYPDGVEGEHFYEKRCPRHRPNWVKTAPIWSERQREPIEYCVVEDLPTLIWIANLADIELHPSLSLAQDMGTPTAIVFDLDPGEPAGLRECCRVALRIRELFEGLDLQTLVKTSGSKGMQVYVPLGTAISYGQTKDFSRAVAQLLEKRQPELVTTRMTRSLRPGKVLVDWSQNDPHKTTVCVYSLRALAQPTVSTPLRWEEVERGSRSRRRELQLSLDPAGLVGLVAREGDLHAELLNLKQALPDFAASGSKPVHAKGARRRFYPAPPEGMPVKEDQVSTHQQGGPEMPPRGVKKGSKRARQYEHVKDGERAQGASERRAEEIAARTVNKERARTGEARSRSRTSTQDISSGRRGGLRSGRPGPRGRTREQLYEEARKLGVEGRSGMNKAELQRAVDAHKG